MMSLPIWAGLVVACGAASAIGVEAVRRMALRHDVVDVPNARSSHARPTPRGGGLAVVLAVAAAWAVGAALEPAVRSVGVPLAVLLVAGVSAVDDVRGLRTGPRFAAQGVAAALLLATVGAWTSISLPFVGTVPVGAFGVVLALLWLVGLTNAVNFMDGIDGIAGTQAVVSGTAWAIIGTGLDLPIVALVGALVAAASAGFLAHNWPPARIFMGDVGAASLGFAFAALPLVAASADGAGDVAVARIPLTGLLVVWPFVFDTAFTIVRRFRRGENVLEAHRSHLYQRLVAAGGSHRQVTSFYAALAGVSAVAGVVWGLSEGNGWPAAGATVALVGVPCAILIRVHWAERRHPHIPK